jgi:Flp pilus assembly protein TadD
MLKQREAWNTAGSVVAAALFLVMFIALSMVVAGCGGGDEGSKARTEVSTRTPARQPARPSTSPSATVAKADTAVAKTVDGVGQAEPAGEPEVVEVAGPVTFEQAETAYFEKRYGAAADLFSRYTARRSANPWGFYMLGLSAWKAGDNATAATAFEEALALDPKHVKSHVNYARVLLETDRDDEALAHIDSALELDPQSNAAHRLRGVALYRQGHVADAIDAYRTAIQRDGEDAWSMNNLGLIYVEQERYTDALPPLAKAVELRGDVSTFHNNLGMALECTGHFRQAESAYQTAMNLEPGSEKAAANYERISVVLEDASVQPVDLAALAQSFGEIVAGWNVETDDEVALREDTFELVPESAEAVRATSEVDTVGTDIEW